MGLRINTNLGSISARRHLHNTTTNFGKSMEKLGSGLRINRAADDAAGLAISEKLKAETRALDQAARNAADGISLVQTAEGYLDEVNNILVRLKELALQSRTGTLTDQDRSYLSEEYYALVDEVNRIAWSSEFNGVSLLDGTGGVVSIQVGTGTTANDRVDVDLTNDIDSLALPLNAGIWDAGFAVTASVQVDNAIETIVALRGDFGAIQNRLESSIRNLGNTAENLAAANSRIRDVDVARESSGMASHQILQQAGVAMLSQSNLVPQLALNLLQ
jgi:flagellin